MNRPHVLVIFIHIRTFPITVLNYGGRRVLAIGGRFGVRLSGKRSGKVSQSQRRQVRQAVQAKYP